MDLADLQRHWDAFGRIDPFWAILTDPDRRGNRWNPAEFFETGRQEMEAHFARAAALGVPAARRRGLDFGCGAGRLTQPLALHVERVVGVDVAPSMIELARRHNAHGARCEYLVNDRPDLSIFANASFDIVYTGRVLQHMEPRYAEAYVSDFVRVLASGGYLSFDLPSEHGFFPEDAAPAARPAGTYRAAIRVLTAPSALPPGGEAHVKVEAVNVGILTFTSGDVNIGNHWAREDGSIVVRDDARGQMELPWAPGDVRQVEVAVTAPADSGTYRLQFDVVEEGVTWFADAGSPIVEATVVVGTESPIVARPVPEPRTPSDLEPAMEMHAVPRQRVEALLAEAGARLLDVRRVYHAGPTWLTFRYDVTKAQD